MRDSYKRPHGFTLIELSIVLVIIGLIVGGVFVGQVLISSAAIRHQIKQITVIAQGLNTFRGKYNQLPGDIYKDAAAFGFTTGNASGPRDNGIINDFGGNAPIIDTLYKPAYFFGHLVQARLIPQSALDGTNGAGVACRALGSGFPSTYYYYALAIKPQMGMVAQTYQGNVWVWMGISNCAVSNIAASSPTGVMNPPLASAIDTKIDDGVPSTGSVVAASSSAQGLDVTAAQCVVTSAGLAYNVTNTSNDCRPMIKLQ